VHFASRLTGWNAVKTRVGQLGLNLDDDQCKQVTAKIKALADVRPIAIDDADSIIRSFHFDIHGDKSVDVKPTNGAVEKGVVNGDANVEKVNGEVNGASLVETNGHGETNGAAVTTEPVAVNGQ
jgi:homocitrate synthase